MLRKDILVTKFDIISFPFIIYYGLTFRRRLSAVNKVTILINGVFACVLAQSRGIN